MHCAKTDEVYVAVTGEAQHDPELKRILNEALLNTPDAMPMVWMGRLQGKRLIRRVYGPDLMLNLCEHSRAENFSHFLYGVVPGIADALVRNLQERFPGLNIAGTFSPPVPSAQQCRGERASAASAQNPSGFFWDGLKHAEAGAIHGAVHVDPARGEDLRRRWSGVRFVDGTNSPGARLDAERRLGMAVLTDTGTRCLARRYLVNNPLFIVRSA